MSSKRLVDFDALPTAALWIEGGVIVAANRAFEALLGVSADAAVGLRGEDLIQRFVVPVDAAHVERNRFAAIETGLDAGYIPLRATDARGQVRSLRVEWRLTEQPDVSVVYLVEEEHDLKVRDFTEALARVAARFGTATREEEVLGGAVDALIAHGFTATVLYAREGDEWLTYGPTGAPGMTRAMLSLETAAKRFPLPVGILRGANPKFDAGEPVFLRDIAPLIDTTFEGELAAELKESQPRSNLIQVPLTIDAGVFGALFVTGEKVTPGLLGPLAMFGELMGQATEGVRIRKRLFERERLAALGEAAAVMAHEVRNPIAAILNAATLLERGAAPNDVLLPVIGEESRRLSRIVSDLLALGRPLEPKLVRVDVASFAARVVEAFVAREPTAVAVLVERADAREGLLDVELAELALENVIRNAVQASPVSGRVRVRVESAANEEARIAVDDEGHGFSEEALLRAFEPFYTTRATGTGVGLALVRRVVEACGGRVELKANDDGGGRVTLVFRGR